MLLEYGSCMAVDERPDCCHVLLGVLYQGPTGSQVFPCENGSQWFLRCRCCALGGRAAELLAGVLVAPRNTWPSETSLGKWGWRRVGEVDE